MTDTLALENLFTRVRSAMLAEGVPAVNLFGWRIPSKQVTGNRIAWQPGDVTGSVGELGPTRSPGGYPRSLATLHELFTVTINGTDKSAPEDELAQTRVTRLLYDAWVRAVHRVAYGAWKQRSVTWVDVSRISERRSGTALRVVAEIESTILDQRWDHTVPATQLIPGAETSAVLEVSELSQTELVGINTPTDELVVEDGELIVYHGVPVTEGDG